MHNVGDYIKATDIAIPAGAVLPFYNVTLSGRYPIFWGSTVADTGWVVCDGGSDLHGGTVPNLSNRFIMGATSVSTANITGGSTNTSSTSVTGNVGYTTLTTAQMPSHNHSFEQYNGGNGGPTSPGYWESRTHITWYTSNTGGSGSHTHSFSISSHFHTSTPPYYSLIYCVKLI